MAEDDHLMRFLRDSGLLPQARLNELLHQVQNSGTSFFHALIQSGMMGEDEARRAYARSLGIPFISLDSADIWKNALLEIPEALCRAHGLIAYRVEEKRLHIALLDLQSLEKVRALRLPFSLVPHLTDRQTIKRGLLKYQDILKELLPKKINEQTGEVLDELKSAQLVDSILEHALSQRASDIHLEPRHEGLLVRHRIAGNLYDALRLPLPAASAIIARIKKLAKLHNTTGDAQSGRFRIERGHETSLEQISFGVSTLPLGGDTASEKVVVAISSSKVGRSGFTLESLGLHGSGLEALHHMLGKPGLLLVSGESRSGVTTLLYALLDQLIDPTRSIATVEDSIELILPAVVQTEAKIHEGVTLGARLRAAVKTDSDILLVSSMSNADVAEITAHAANRGLIVLSSVEASSARTALLELAEVVEPRLLESILQGIVLTRLVRKLCPKHEKTKLTHGEIEELERRGADLQKILIALEDEGYLEPHAQWRDVLFGAALPCEECDDGYTGLIGLQEIVVPTLTLKQRLHFGTMEEEYPPSVEQLSLLEDGIFKAALGQTSIAEVLSASM